MPAAPSVPPSRTDPSVELTVADALELDELHGIEVLAGQAGLARLVTGVNIIEVPDVWQWLHGGEFLLTSGYPWRDDPTQLVPLLEQLAVAGISAVGFKLGSYMRALPPELLEAADALRIPLLVLPPTVAYRDVFEPLYRRLLSLSIGGPPSRSTDQALLRFGLDDQSIDKVAGALAGQLGHQVRVVDLLDDVVHVAAPDGTCAVRAVDRLDDTSALVDALAEHHLRRQITCIEDSGTRALAAALVVGRRRHGYILVLGHQPGDEHRLAAEVAHAAELVSFLLLKRIAFRDGRRQASSLFFESLMSDTLTEGEATERASALGIRLAKPSSVVIIGMLGDGQLLGDEWDLLRQHFEGCVGPEATTATAEVHGGRLQALVQTSAIGQEPWGSLMRCMEDRAVLRPGLLPVLAVGAPGSGRDGVRRSRREALIAYQTAQRLGRHGVTRFGDLGVERLLSQIPMTPLTQEYVDSLLHGLTEEPELLHTLEVYLEHGGNKSATAAAIPLHRSSLLYRLDKISRTVGVDLSDPERRNELWLALRLRRMISPSGQ